MIKELQTIALNLNFKLSRFFPVQQITFTDVRSLVTTSHGDKREDNIQV